MPVIAQSTAVGALKYREPHWYLIINLEPNSAVKAMKTFSQYSFSPLVLPMASNQAANLYFQSPLSIILTPGHQRLWFRGRGSILKTCRKPVFKACSHTSTLHPSIILVRWEKTEKEGGLFDQWELTNTFQILNNSCYTLKFANQTLFLDIGNS